MTRRTYTTWGAVAGAVLLVASIAAVNAVGLYLLLPPGFSGEADRLAAVLQLGPGSRVADVGAGGGALAVALASRVGARGRVYATELPGEIDRLRRRVERSGLPQVTVLEASPTATNLPDGCCDALILRTVYHHVREPERLMTAIRRAIRPGGRLAVIDFPPGAFWHLLSAPPDSDPRRTGHGVPVRDLIAEVRRAGFMVRETTERWSGSLFLVVFEAPAAPADQEGR